MREDLIHELRVAASALERQAAVRGRLAEAARIGWLGPHRSVFDEEHRRLAARAHLLAEACRRAAVTAATAEGTTLTRAGRFS